MKHLFKQANIPNLKILDIFDCSPVSGPKTPISAPDHTICADCGNQAKFKYFCDKHDPVTKIDEEKEE